MGTEGGGRSLPWPSPLFSAAILSPPINYFAYYSITAVRDQLRQAPANMSPTMTAVLRLFAEVVGLPVVCVSHGRQPDNR